MLLMLKAAASNSDSLNAGDINTMARLTTGDGGKLRRKEEGVQ
jgi:hypothetical protein